MLGIEGTLSMKLRNLEFILPICGFQIYSVEMSEYLESSSGSFGRGEWDKVGRTCSLPPISTISTCFNSFNGGHCGRLLILDKGISQMQKP